LFVCFYFKNADFNDGYDFIGAMLMIPYLLLIVDWRGVLPELINALTIQQSRNSTIEEAFVFT